MHRFGIVDEKEAAAAKAETEVIGWVFIVLLIDTIMALAKSAQIGTETKNGSVVRKTEVSMLVFDFTVTSWRGATAYLR